MILDDIFILTNLSLTYDTIDAYFELFILFFAIVFASTHFEDNVVMAILTVAKLQNIGGVFYIFVSTLHHL